MVSEMSEKEYQDELSDRLVQLHKDHFLAQGSTNDAYYRFMDMAQALIGCDSIQKTYIRTEFLFRPENCN